MNYVKAFLQFFNVLEDDSPALSLSLSKIGMWVVLFVVIRLTLKSPENVGMVISSFLSTLPLVANYIHQRQVQNYALLRRLKDAKISVG